MASVAISSVADAPAASPAVTAPRPTFEPLVQERGNAGAPPSEPKPLQETKTALLKAIALLCFRPKEGSYCYPLRGLCLDYLLLALFSRPPYVERLFFWLLAISLVAYTLESDIFGLIFATYPEDPCLSVHLSFVWDSPKDRYDFSWHLYT